MHTHAFEGKEDMFLPSRIDSCIGEIHIYIHINIERNVLFIVIELHTRRGCVEVPLFLGDETNVIPNWNLNRRIKFYKIH